MRTHPLLLASFVALSVAVVPFVAIGHGADPMLSSNLWSQNQAVNYHWKSGQVPPSWMKPAIHAAATDNNESKRSKAATFAYSSGGAGVVSYGEPSGCGPNGIACMSRTVPTTYRIKFRKQGYAFDWGTLRWCQAYSSAPDGCFDVENITLDEFGHVQGLAHHVNYSSQSDYTTAIVQTVSHAKPKSGWNRHAYASCDTATLQKKYDLKSQSTKVSTCLDLATKTTLSRSAPGHSTNHITLTATLKTATSTGYGKLSAQTLAGRRVKLQKRSSSTASWTYVADMVVSDNVYKYDVQSTTSQWRAVFSTPDDEGVNGSSSAAITARGY
jgi:hypothetical protein